MARYTASQIAKWFLAYNNIHVAEESADYISNMKLQKLLYYAQGVYMGITGKKLFDDPICAWKHGPVVPDVYHEYKNFGSNGINLDEPFNLETFDTETENILKSVYNNFSQFSAWKLREMTHNEEPWKSTEQSQEINPQLIKDFFVKEYIE